MGDVARVTGFSGAWVAKMGFGLGSGRDSTGSLGFRLETVLGFGFGFVLEDMGTSAVRTGNGGATSDAAAGADSGEIADAGGAPDAPGAAAGALDDADPGGISVTITGSGFGGAAGGGNMDASNQPAALRCASADKPTIAICWPQVGRMTVTAFKGSWIQ